MNEAADMVFVKMARHILILVTAFLVSTLCQAQCQGLNITIHWIFPEACRRFYSWWVRAGRRSCSRSHRELE
jgi:hypothetical protein